MPMTISFFEPVIEIWEMLLKADKLRTSQINITMQRFRELVYIYIYIKLSILFFYVSRAIFYIMHKNIHIYIFPI